MMRPLFALFGAVALLLVWLGLVVYQAGGDMASAVAALGDSAQRVHLPGLAAKAYLQASRLDQYALALVGRQSVCGPQLIQQIIKRRLAAARVLLDAGYVPAAERIALEGARADFGDLQARAMLLEVRLHGPDPDAARRELMLLVLQEEHPRLLSLLGQAFAASGRLEDARSFYQRALTRDPSYLPALLGMAQLAAAGYDRNEINKWLDQAARAAETPDEKRAVARLRPPMRQPLQQAWTVTRSLAREHGGSALFLAAFLVFLFSPSLAHLIRRRA
jgi:tetratricopeptide (TPR) repeat protein